MTRKHAKMDQGGEPLIALFVAMAAILGGFLLINGKEAMSIFTPEFLNTNRIAITFHFVTVCLLALILAMVFRPRANLLSKDLRNAFQEFQNARQLKVPLRQILLPQIVLVGVTLVVLEILFRLHVTTLLWPELKPGSAFISIQRVVDVFTRYGTPTVYSVFLVLFFHRSGFARRWYKRILSIADYSLSSNGTLPLPPDLKNGNTPRFILGARESISSRRFEPSALVPSWVSYAAPEIYGGMAIFGMKGSGKTQMILRLIDQALAYKASNADQKMALCVIDLKGDMTSFIHERARRYGRTADVVHLGVDTVAHWNPIGHLCTDARFHDCRQAGYFVRAAMSIGGQQAGNDKYWEDNADNLCARTLHLLALSGKDVNFAAVYKFVTSLSNKDETGAQYRDELYQVAKRNVATSAAQSEELQESIEYFENEFVHLDNRVRTIVINVASNFLQKFMTVEYKRAFGGNTSNSHHFAGFREHIANGGIFVLDIRTNEHGTIANPIASLCKLFYMAAVKTRDRYANDSGLRKTMFIADEYQGYVTPSSSQTEGDDRYFETSRSFGAIDVVASQQFSSIVAATGEAMAQRILGNFNTIITYKHNDPRLTKYLSELVGTEEVTSESLSIQEGSNSAKPVMFRENEHAESDHSVSRSVTFSKRDKPLIDANVFKELSQFEAIGVIDGFGPRRITRFYTKPSFVDLQTLHRDVMKIISEGA